MIRFLFGFAVLAAALAGFVFLLPTPDAADRPVAGGASSTLAITNVTVFDGTAFDEDQTIVIDGARIAAAGPGIAPPQGATVLDGTGLVALPGLIDAHTHSWGEALTAALDFGVTAQLDMFGAASELPATRAAREDLSVTDRADLFSAGMLATVEGGHGTQFGVPVDTLAGPDEAERWVEARIEEGSDYIKLVYMPRSPWFESLDLDIATALIEAAHARGLLAVAHIDTLEGAREMVAAGIDGLVHIFADAPADAAFLEAAREADVFVIPTLAVIASIAAEDGARALAADPRVADRLSASARRSLEGGFGMPPSPRYQYPLAAANVRALHEAGVTILAGSDAPNPGTAYGVSLHHELQLLTAAGLSPAEALRAATEGPARAFGLENRGVIAPGARADLVLLEANPREGVNATLSIANIVRNGVLAGETAQPGAGGAGVGLDTNDIAVFDAATNGFAWTATTDAMAGGSSTAALSAEGGVLRTEIAVRPGFAFPWAGPGYFPASQSASALDLSGRTLVLRLRAAPGEYRVMVFNPELAGVPPMVSITLDEDWTTVRLELDDIGGFESSAFAGFAVVGGPALGEGWIEIGEARFETAP
ncbi:MAG: amidohydrolase family protein [Oceanicaulis sp.]